MITADAISSRSAIRHTDTQSYETQLLTGNDLQILKMEKREKMKLLAMKIK